MLRTARITRTHVPTQSAIGFALASALLIATAACGDAVELKEVGDVTTPTATPSTDSSVGVVTPGTPVVQVSLTDAEKVYQEKNYGEAAELFAVYTDQHPNNPWGHYMLGLSAWKSGDRERAVSAFETSLTLDPSHVKSMLNLGRVLLEMGRAEDALKQIESASAIDTGSADVQRLLGRTYGELRRVDEAVDSYKRAIVIDGEDVWSMNNLGFLLINEGRYEEALLPLARAVELRGDVAVFRNNLGVALERTGHFTLAAESFRKALEADSTYAKASVSLARVELLKEKPETVPVDLGELARRFVEEMDAWKGTEAAAIEHNC